MKKLLFILSLSFISGYADYFDSPKKVNENLVFIKNSFVPQNSEYTSSIYFAYYTETKKVPLREQLAIYDEIEKLYCENKDFINKLQYRDLVVYITNFNGIPLFKFLLQKSNCNKN